MRVLFWTDWFLPSVGGVEVFAARLLPALARRGHDVTVIAGHHCTGLPDAQDFAGVTVRRFWFHQVLARGDVERMSQILARVARIKRELSPDLIHLNTLGPSVLFHLETMRWCAAPTLLTMHSPVSKDASRNDTLHGRALRSASWVNCNSRAVRADLCRHAGEIGRRASVTYYGMDVPAAAPPRPRELPRLLVYGRLVADKGFDIAVRAFALIVHRFPNARLVVAGDGAARPSLERLVDELELGFAVDFLGMVPPEDVAALLGASSVVVVPSRWNEPFGLVALEAALMARPVVAACTGGLAEVVEDGRTGILVEPEDPAALACAVARLIEDPDAADRMGIAARERARERFAWEDCVNEYERLYAQVQSLEKPHV